MSQKKMSQGEHREEKPVTLAPLLPFSQHTWTFEPQTLLKGKGGGRRTWVRQ